MLPQAPAWTLAPVLLLLALGPAGARTLVVGPDQPLKLPSAAASIAADGDAIEIEAQEGGYFDCAVWRANRLTIEGSGRDVVITDKVCQGKALFVIAGSDITVRNLTFQRARTADKNGAGIRAEGRNLVIEGSRFINNESGVLAADKKDSIITIRDSDFEENGRCDPCAHAVSVGRIAALAIDRSRFGSSKGGDYILSLALATRLDGDTIEDGPDGKSDYDVELRDGGSLVMRDNELERGLQARPGLAAVVIRAAIGAQPVDDLAFSGNRLQNDTGGTTIFIQNWTGRSADLANNALGANTVAVSSDGYRWFEAKAMTRRLIAEGKGVISSAKRWLRKLL
jgi:hypothetical protein